MTRDNNMKRTKKEIALKTAIFLAIVGLCAFMRIDLLFRVFCVTIMTDAVFD